LTLQSNRSLLNSVDNITSSHYSLVSAESDYELKIEPAGSATIYGGSGEDGSDIENFAIGISQKFITGTLVEIIPSINRDYDEDENYETGIGAYLTRPLLKGLSLEYNLSGIKSAEFGERTSMRSLYLSKVSMMIRTVQNVYDIIRIEEVLQGAAVIESALTRFHHQVKDYQLIIPQELIREAQQTQKIFNIVLGGIAGISLLVGGIGIMNIMLATVSERTREIGIRRAVGANQRDIAVQFLTEAIILTVTEGIIGSILGCAISIFISVLAGWETVVTGWAVVAALGMAIIVGVIFGFYPAYNAAKLDPIQALRNE